MPVRPRAPSRLLTVPNVITLVRFLLIPVFVILVAEEEPITAALLLGFLGATDWIDGWVARHFDQESEIGRIIDPVADRVLLVVAAVTLLVDASAPSWALVLVLAREAVISIATLSLAIAGARRLDVVWSGKAGTLALMFGLPSFLLESGLSGWSADLVLLGAWIFTLGGLALSYYAAFLYVPAAREALREGRQGPSGIQSSP